MIIWENSRKYLLIAMATSVIDTSNLCIHVFNNEGVLLRSFGCDSKSMKLFRVPRGVCVSDRHVFVSDVNYCTSSVLVFTVAGDYVTSFGQYGSKQGQFEIPYMFR